MKSKILKGLLVASSLVFMNCGNDSVSASSGSNVAPDPSQEISLSSVAEEVLSSSSATDVMPVESSSSQVVAPEISSSSIVLESSSSQVVAPEVSSSSITPESSSAEEISSSSVAARSKIYLAQAADESDGVEIEFIENTGYNGQGILAFPKNVNLAAGEKLGVVVWGPGGDTAPGMYGGMIRRLASHGFVVIALSISPGTGENATAAINWLEEKNEDSNGPLYQKMDLEHVACAGHSMGGLESEQAAIKDARVVTAILNNSGDKKHVAMGQIPAEKSAVNIYGEAGIEKDNARADYNNENVKAQACLIQMVGGPQGGEGGWGHGSASWSGIGATVAWIRWKIGGEDRQADFVGTSGKYINGPILGAQGNWDGQCKNF
ncbi:hypothetical protein [Fibrobacter sp. UWEL]|uniref:poly(ethylene terephthalate) hydrolase family protein n=1 Tax=Fibrobacter sp. UWEL TaxID=1896209 RepID=UPI00091571C8|nr:hypothetical protein [Fibrobacter sp. UWEL]SHK47506.1 Chlorophyllase enzyme [Fibrobacter sp. UWEL]